MYFRKQRTPRPGKVWGQSRPVGLMSSDGWAADLNSRGQRALGHRTPREKVGIWGKIKHQRMGQCEDTVKAHSFVNEKT